MLNSNTHQPSLSSEFTLAQKKHIAFWKNKSLLITSFPTLILLGLSIFIPSFISFLYGISANDCLIFLIYAFVYHGLNGFLLLSFIKFTL